MIHNLASKKESVVLLAVNNDGLSLIINKMLTDAPHDSALFVNTLKAVAAIMFTLPPNKQLKVDSMSKMIDAGLLKIFNATLRASKNRDCRCRAWRRCVTWPFDGILGNEVGSRVART